MLHEQAPAAQLFVARCPRLRGRQTALVVGAGDCSERELSKTLAQLRPWSLMVVIAGNDEFVVDMMSALRV